MLPFTFQYCQKCDWIDQGRNYGVIPIKDGIVSVRITKTTCCKIHLNIIFATWSVYMTFAVVCTFHIIRIINEYDRKRYAARVRKKIFDLAFRRALSVSLTGEKELRNEKFFEHPGDAAVGINNQYLIRASITFTQKVNRTRQSLIQVNRLCNNLK